MRATFEEIANEHLLWMVEAEMRAGNPDDPAGYGLDVLGAITGKPVAELREQHCPEGRDYSDCVTAVAAALIRARAGHGRLS